MKRVWRKITEEWEVSLCGLALAGVLGAFLVGWGRFQTDHEDPLGRRQASRQSSLLAPDAIAFLNRLPEPDIEPPSPFVFEGQTRAPRAAPTSRPRPQPSRRPPREPAPPTPQETPPPPAPEPEPEPEPVQPIRRVVHGVRQIAYLYNTRGASGRPLAAIQVHNPATNETSPPAMLPIGGVVDGIRIVSFDEEKLVVQDGRGRRHQISFGRSARVSSAPQIIEVRP